LLILTMLIAVSVALWVSRADHAVVDWVIAYWNRFSLWVQHLVS
ncbi:MAG: thiamine pyrophosphokinase, partial [Mycolicibacterium sp.]|nr:thiamine pyrophosphokinase [Mycolicibacterium sp.]